MVKKSGQKKTEAVPRGRKLSLGDSFRYGIEKTGKFFWPTLGIAILTQAVLVLLQILQVASSILGIIVFLFFILVSVLITVGWIKILLAVLNGQKPALKYFSWDDVAYFWTMLGVYILTSLIVSVGYLLLVIPGVVWALTYALAPLLVVDKNLSVTQALAASRRYTTGHRWTLFLWYLAVGALNLLGLLLVGVGLLFTLPVSFYSGAYMYGKLTGKTIK
ncbi:MAG: hypothetical protein LBD99_07145 [Candidatus Margulisbacteria bacterium]|jgi:uncharacterized membrane protein|nr:hypothetical protein [Candidatus Margulisiibacteriota bacterium]